MIDKYYVILAVGAFIIDNKGKLLIVKKSPFEKVDGGLWTVPGGKVFPNESIIAALKREIKEEVGLRIIDFRWIGEDVFQNGGYWYHGQHFRCRVKKTAPVILEKNLLEYHWLSKKEIGNFEFHPNIRKRILELL